MTVHNSSLNILVTWLSKIAKIKFTIFCNIHLLIRIKNIKIQGMISPNEEHTYYGNLCSVNSTLFSLPLGMNHTSNNP